MSSAPQPTSVPDQAQKFARFIRETREAKGLSLNQLCKQVGLSIGYMSQMERGLVAGPRETSIIRIAEVLELNPDLLLSMAGKVRRKVLQSIWNSPLITRILSQATGLPRETATQIAKNIAASIEGK